MVSPRVMREPQVIVDAPEPKVLPSVRSGENQLSRAEQLSRWFHTLRYHRPGQLTRRAISIARQRWPVASRGRVSRDANLSFNGSSPELVAVAQQVERLLAETAAGAVAEAASGRLRFLNQEIELGSPVNWLQEDVPRLWRFQLHYHEWLFGLSAEGAKDARHSREATWGIIDDWISRFPDPNVDGASDAWHPFCISRRVPVWTSLWAIRPPSDSQADRIAESLYAQSHHLAHRLEKDLGGNHLLENARGLAFAGAYFSGREAERWRESAVKIVRSEVGDQVLPHGEHFERSPMYHCQMLALFADLRDLFRVTDPTFSAECAEVVSKMSGFLTAILHPDGDIPLLGDSCRGESASPGSLLSRSVVADGVAFETNGAPQGANRLGSYWTFREDDDFLLFDAGAVGPDHLPAHAHADLLNIEMSVAGRRLIVDSGVYDYESGEMRQYCRSTAAHNVLEFDGENQCDVWSRFRMGRRGWPSRLAAGAVDEIEWAAASHNAYRHLGAACVARWVGCRTDGTWFIADWVEGRGAHRLVNRLHLHPDADAEQVSEDRFNILLADRLVSVSVLGGGCGRISQGWYCPEFGRRNRTQVLECSVDGTLPAVTGWQIHVNGSSSPAQLDWAAGSGPVLGFDESSLSLRECLNA